MFRLLIYKILYRKINTCACNKNNPFLFYGKGYIVSSKSVSRVLYCRKAISIINLALPLLTGLNNLPIPESSAGWRIAGASNSASGTYLVFQLLRFTAISGRPEMP